jgi:hypothetical protein
MENDRKTVSQAHRVLSCVSEDEPVSVHETTWPGGTVEQPDNLADGRELEQPHEVRQRNDGRGEGSGATKDGVAANIASS